MKDKPVTIEFKFKIQASGIDDVITIIETKKARVTFNGIEVAWSELDIKA
jgi:hypothetical protein